jgi:proline dehydrogenase
MISFNNTQTAFAYKSDTELKRARLLFTLMGNKFFLNIGLKLLPLLVKIRFPFIKTIVRNTLFKQFVGGETLEQTAPLSDLLNRHRVQVILDYGAEAGESEQSFDEAANQFIKVITYAATQRSIPFMSIKVTAIARFGLLEKIDAAMHASDKDDLQERYGFAIDQLNEEELKEWNKSVSRLISICEAGNKHTIGVLIDAEESWVQDPVDALAMQLMEKYNRDKCVVFNTYQMYRHDRFEFLKNSHAVSNEKNITLGVKLVRGAYMEKERERAIAFNYRSPIHEDKDAVDRDYDQALEYCLTEIKNISLVVASHNEQSNLHCTKLISQYSLPANHPHIHFSQLYGMSDHITFNLAQHGFNASKYIPFGPIKDVVPYLMRRAKENSSVAGQTGRELGLIKKELQIRGCEDVKI